MTRTDVIGIAAILFYVAIIAFGIWRAAKAKGPK